MIYEVDKTDSVAALFGEWQDTMIWSCLQGIMGHIYVDNLAEPVSAMALLGDFCFLAGEPDRELAAFRPEWYTKDFMIIIPQNQQWGREIERCYAGRFHKVERYAMKKEADVFDRDRLENMVSRLPEEYTIHMIDAEVFDYCRKAAEETLSGSGQNGTSCCETWCVDFVSQFPNYCAYQRNGLGVVIMHEGMPVAGASSYTAYCGGIEIEIDTKQEYRRRGLATICGAKLILECLARGLYPSWDAQNLWSVALAEKLGYHFDHAYEAYEIYS